MKINVIKIRRTALLLALLMLLSVALAACVNLDEVPEVNPKEALGTTSGATGETSEDELITPDGATDAPVVSTIVNITPSTVALSGTCEAGATIRVSGGKEDVETTANGTYFIIETELTYQKNLLRVTAQVEGKEKSLEREVIASRDATAETRLDGNSVSVGAGSRLYFDKMVEDANGSNLYTASQLKDIRNYINDTVSSYYNDRAGAQPVELIYVLVPNATTIYPEVFPEGVVTKPFSTVYDQVLETLGNTQATVVDMREIFMNLRDDATVNETYGGLYRVTDSALTDYGAYLTYNEIMKIVSVNFPDAAPRAIDEFEWNKITAKGGNLVNYRELDGSVINEEIVTATPKFDMKLGSNKIGNSSIASLVKYLDVKHGDYGYFNTNDTEDGPLRDGERRAVQRAELPERFHHIIYG